MTGRQERGKRCIGSRMLLFVLVASAVIVRAASASEHYAGKITAIDSGSSPEVVNVVRPGKSDFAVVRTGDIVFPGDTLKTGQDVKAQIEMPDRSVVNMGPNSVLRIKASILKAEEAKRNYVFKTFKGTIRFIIAKALGSKNGATTPWRDSTVVVETTTAVAGVRGTDFVTITDMTGAVPQVEIAVLEGLVSVRNIALPINGAITLSANQVSTVYRGASPTAAAPLSEQRRDALTHSTTPRSGPGSGDQQDRQQGKVRKKGGYGKSDVARDVAAGMPLAQLINDAVDKGMPIGAVVDAAIDAGVPAYDVVYTAVTEGFPAIIVIESAIKTGAALQEVVSAAVMGGAETRAVMTAAQGAGVPDDVIASSVASADAAVSSTYGYQSPVSTNTTPPTIPQSTPVIGGGGGAPPKTGPASPYKP